MQQITQNNPQIAQLMQIAKNYGSPQNAFYTIAREKGVNPEEFMRELFN